jgi:hypothetical protein
MKITVITDERGDVIGTAGKPESTKPEAGTGGPVAGPGQKIREVELPKALQGIDDIAELHRKLKDHLGK